MDASKTSLNDVDKPSMGSPDPARTPRTIVLSRPERLFPTLTATQMSRIAAHGRRRATTRGEVLVEVGDQPVPFFVVVSGEVQVLRPSDGVETLIVSHHAGQFSGEANLLTGRRSLAQLRVAEAGDVIELTRDALLALVQEDAELSEILMRSFIDRKSVV